MVGWKFLWLQEVAIVFDRRIRTTRKRSCGLRPQELSTTFSGTSIRTARFLRKAIRVARWSKAFWSRHPYLIYSVFLVGYWYILPDVPALKLRWLWSHARIVASLRLYRSCFEHYLPASMQTLLECCWRGSMAQRTNRGRRQLGLSNGIGYQFEV